MKIVYKFIIPTQPHVQAILVVAEVEVEVVVVVVVVVVVAGVVVVVVVVVFPFWKKANSIHELQIQQV